MVRIQRYVRSVLLYWLQYSRDVIIAVDLTEIIFIRRRFPSTKFVEYPVDDFIKEDNGAQNKFKM